jgi:hypothetical protein
VKKILILFCLSINFGLLHAQRFFYVDNNGITDKLVRDGLLNASQFVTGSELSSDYIIKTEVSFQAGDNLLTVHMNLQDTATLQTLFQVKETLAFGELGINPRVVLHTVIRAFIDRNIGRVISCVKGNHFDDHSTFLRVRKDQS